MGEGGRGVGRGRGEQGGGHEGAGKLSWVKAERENKERNTLKEPAFMGLARNKTLGNFPAIHKHDFS